MTGLEHLITLGQETEEEFEYLLLKGIVTLSEIANYKQNKAKKEAYKKQRAAMSSNQRAIVDIGTSNRSRCL